MSVSDFIAARAVRPEPAKEQEQEPAAPAATDVGQMIREAVQAVQQASPEIARWLQEQMQGAAGMGGELTKIRETLERIEALLKAKE